MRTQVILDSLFARPGSDPIGGGKKGEFRDLTRKPSNFIRQQNPKYFPLRNFPALVLHRNTMILQHLIIQFPLIICEVGSLTGSGRSKNGRGSPKGGGGGRVLRTPLYGPHRYVRP